MSSSGPAIRAVCRILNQNSCGSGSVCGYHPEGGSFVMTNAHVASSRIGRRVIVEVESLNRKRFEGVVIRAAYSSSVSADWALLHVPELTEIEPVYLTRDLPKQGESMYTKGFPRCQAHRGTDIEQYATMNNGVLLWEPDAIGGQSGSGVWGDNDHLQKALLTWSIQYRGKWRGAGQLTAEIYRQNRDFVLGRSLRGAARNPEFEYKELPSEEHGLNDIGSDIGEPELVEGIFSEPIKTGIQDYPIWIENVEPPEPDEPAPGTPPNTKRTIAVLTKIVEQAEKEIADLQGQETEILDPADPETDSTFGL